MKKQKTHTYTAFYSDGTVKVGYCADVMERMRTLGGSSSCFVCFRATHQDEETARETEKQIKLKKSLNKFNKIVKIRQNRLYKILRERGKKV